MDLAAQPSVTIRLGPNGTITVSVTAGFPPVMMLAAAAMLSRAANKILDGQEAQQQIINELSHDPSLRRT